MVWVFVIVSSCFGIVVCDWALGLNGRGGGGGLGYILT